MTARATKRAASGRKRAVMSSQPVLNPQGHHGPKRKRDSDSEDDKRKKQKKDASKPPATFLLLPTELRQEILLRAVGFCTLRHRSAAIIDALPRSPNARAAAVAALPVVPTTTSIAASPPLAISTADVAKYNKFRRLCQINQMTRGEMGFVERQWLTHGFPMDILEFRDFVNAPDPRITTIALAMYPRDLLQNPPQSLINALPPNFDSTTVEGLEMYRRYWATLMRSLPDTVREIEIVGTIWTQPRWRMEPIFRTNINVRDGYEPREALTGRLKSYILLRKKNVVNISQVRGIDSAAYDEWAWL